jgi:hypothetical protein
MAILIPYFCSLWAEISVAGFHSIGSACDVLIHMYVEALLAAPERGEGKNIYSLTASRWHPWIESRDSRAMTAADG